MFAAVLEVLAAFGSARKALITSDAADLESASLPLVPYLDTLRWVFIAVTLGGTAVTIYARLDDWKRGQRRRAGSSLSSPAAQRAKRWALRWEPSQLPYSF